MKQFLKEIVKIYYDLLKTQVRFLINYYLKVFKHLDISVCTYDFSTLYTTLPYNLIKEKLTEVTEQTFNREGSLHLACNEKRAFFTSE